MCLIAGMAANLRQASGQAVNLQPSTAGQANPAWAHATFRDPRTGHFYRLVPKQVQQVVPQWVAETRRVPQTQYVPATQYQLQARWVGRWNPFAQPSLRYEYVPITYWQTKQTEIDVPIRYAKYVVQDQVVLVPEAVLPGQPLAAGTMANVPATQSVQNPPVPTMTGIEGGPRINPSQMAANQAQSLRQSPLVPMHGFAATGYYPATAPNNQAYAPVPLGSVASRPILDLGRWFPGAPKPSVQRPPQVPTIANAPAWNPNGPLFQQPLLAGRDRGSIWGTAWIGPAGQGIAPYGPGPLPPPHWQGTVAWNQAPPAWNPGPFRWPPAGPNSQTAAIPHRFGREFSQTGMPVTELR
jgi:hypothetical protein